MLFKSLFKNNFAMEGDNEDNCTRKTFKNYFTSLKPKHFYSKKLDIVGNVLLSYFKEYECESLIYLEDNC